MAKENVDVLPVISEEKNMIIGILTYRDIISTYRQNIEEHKKMPPGISLKRRGLKILVHGQKFSGAIKSRDK
jgi:CIC family chloride channel protein